MVSGPATMIVYAVSVSICLFAHVCCIYLLARTYLIPDIFYADYTTIINDVSHSFHTLKR